MTFLLGLVSLLPPLCSDPAGAHAVDHTSPRHISLHFAQPTLTCMSWKKRPELTDLITVAHQLLGCSTVACAGPSFVFGMFWVAIATGPAPGRLLPCPRTSYADPALGAFTAQTAVMPKELLLCHAISTDYLF